MRRRDDTVQHRGYRESAGIRPLRRIRLHVTAASSTALDLQGQSVVVLGLGKSGRSAAKLALLRGAKAVIGMDLRADLATLESDPELLQMARARSASLSTLLGPHDRSVILRSQRLVLSPGVPLNQPDVAEALGQGVPTSSELSFACEALPPSVPTVGVTGTNGKSTVTTFAGQLLRGCGLLPWVGGNLGTPLSDLSFALLSSPPDARPCHVAVVEASSYQLELPGAFRPCSAVITNLTPDHLERHKTMDAYAAAKMRIFDGLDQEKGTAVLPYGNELLLSAYTARGSQGNLAFLDAPAHSLPGARFEPRTSGRGLLHLSLPWVRPTPSSSPALSTPTVHTLSKYTLSLDSFRPLGRHNDANLASAVAVVTGLAGAWGPGLGHLSGRITPLALQESLQLLQPPPHRMEDVGTLRGVRWINDSKATNIESTEVALRALGDAGIKAVVLLGGQAKKDASGSGRLGFARLAPLLAAQRAVVCYGQDGAQIASELQQAGVGVQQCRTLEEACSWGMGRAGEGEALLLSPACASFDQFRNFEHRGGEFAALRARL